MGIFSYYMRFIGQFSKVACYITSLQYKGTKFQWMKRCEERFQMLQNILTSSPTLKITNAKKYCVVCIDACKEGTGGVSMQDNHVVCYESMKLRA